MIDTQFNWPCFAKKLRTAAADEEDTDLAFFDEEFRNVRIVALGEATHGSREIFQMKHRMISYLVRKLGFRVVSIEAGIEPCRNIGAYIGTGKGDIKKALSSQSYWTWDTAEVMDLLEWMRSYNLGCVKGEECRFVGFDMKPIEGACDNLRKLLLERALPDLDQALQIISACRDVIWYHSKPQTLPDVAWLSGWFAIHQADLRSFCTEAALQNALSDTLYISQFVRAVEEIQTSREMSTYGLRDEFMARNIKRILDENPNDKVIVWAHNGHIAIDDRMKNMGWFLRNMFGSQYYSAGIFMGAGGFQSRDMQTMELRSYLRKEPFPGTWESEMYESFCKQNWFLQIREGCEQSNEFAEWAQQTKPALMIGSAYELGLSDEEYQKSFLTPVSLAKQYDGVFYLGQVQRARPNLLGQR